MSDLEVFKSRIVVNWQGSQSGTQVWIELEICLFVDEFGSIEYGKTGEPGFGVHAEVLLMVSSGR